MVQALEEDYGNPSSLYRLGLEAEKRLKAARQAVAASLGAEPDEIFFTSGGTESDDTVLKGVWESRKKQGKRIITTAVEHPAILKTAEWLERQGAEIIYLPVDSQCRISLDDFRGALNKDTILVSVMAVNNESGTIMPIKELRRIMDEQGSTALLHTDAVQAWGKIPLDARDLGVDFISVSGHKIHGPKGVGALYIKKGVYLPVFIHGGGQEKGMRSGTENMPGIAGIGTAAALIPKELGRAKNMAAARERLLQGIKDSIPDIKVNSPDDGVCSVLNVSFLGCRGEVILHSLDTAGICVSTGSACSSHSKGSHVLTAMGLRDREIEGAVRFSFCADNTLGEMDYVIEKLTEAVGAQRRLRNAFRKG